MFSSNKIQNGTTAIGKKAEEYEFGHIKVVYNKVKTKVKRREERVLLHADNRSNTVTNPT